MTSELRPAVEVYRDASYADAKGLGTVQSELDAAAVIEADREAVRAPLLAEIERLREANQAAAECVAAMMEECARYRAALAGDSHD